MAGREEQFESGLPETYGTRFRQKSIWQGRWFILQAHLLCPHGGFHQQFQFTVVELRFQAVVIKNEFIAQYMVIMAVRIKQQGRLQVVIINKANDLVLIEGGVHTRVNNGTLAAVVMYNIGVFANKAIGK